MSKAFTLAEVLITLGIIGVVAAMTLPALINKTHGAQYRTALQKSYSILQQALQSLNADQGFVAKRDTYANRTFANYYKQYFKIAKDCNLTDCISRSTDDESGSDAVIKNYKTYSKSRYVESRYFDDGQFILTDGMVLLIEDNTALMGEGNNNSGVGAMFITVDVNGYNKKPNAWGHDLFTFQIMNDSGKLLPMGAEGTTFTDMSQYCSAISSNAQNGIACTYKALTDKDYFNNLP